MDEYLIAGELLFKSRGVAVNDGVFIVLLEGIEGLAGGCDGGCIEGLVGGCDGGCIYGLVGGCDGCCIEGLVGGCDGGCIDGLVGGCDGGCIDGLVGGCDGGCLVVRAGFSNLIRNEIPDNGNAP